METNSNNIYWEIDQGFTHQVLKFKSRKMLFYNPQGCCRMRMYFMGCKVKTRKIFHISYHLVPFQVMNSTQVMNRHSVWVCGMFQQMGWENLFLRIMQWLAVYAQGTLRTSLWWSVPNHLAGLGFPDKYFLPPLAHNERCLWLLTQRPLVALSCCLVIAHKLPPLSDFGPIECRVMFTNIVFLQLERGTVSTEPSGKICWINE